MSAGEWDVWCPHDECMWGYVASDEAAAGDALRDHLGNRHGCEGCGAAAGESCRVWCLSSVTDDTGQPTGGDE